MSDVMEKPTTSPISTRKHGDVLIILSNNPPVNALSTPVRQGLVDAIAEAEGDDSVNAVVIACEGQTFFAGADITEFGKPPVMPWLLYGARRSTLFCANRKMLPSTVRPVSPPTAQQCRGTRRSSTAIETPVHLGK